MDKKDFKFKKEFGQNFIFDTNFLSSLVKSFNLCKDSNIVEIGAGMGTLTSCLAENFKNVVSFEIDKTLTEHLKEIEGKHSNLKFIFNDILKVDNASIDNLFNGENFVVIANLPYYITSQIVFKFLFGMKNLQSMFVMVQKEVGERYCAKEGGKEYGIPTVLINTFGSCKIVKNVSKTMFTPPPKIDSCVIQIDIEKDKFNIDNIEKYQNFISNAFRMRRKTLYNNLSSYASKEKIRESILALGLSESIRPEQLSVEEFVKLFEYLK